MATTKRSDLIVPEVLLDAVQGAFAGVTALNNTGAAVVNSSLPNSARGGDTVKVPYFGTIGDFETLAADEGGAGAVPSLTPSKLTMDEDESTVEHGGKAFEITTWAQLAASFADPYAEGARQIRVGFERFIDANLITLAETTTLSNDITGAAVKTINYDAVVDSKLLWGDEQDDIVLMVVHSKQYGDLLKLRDDQNRPLVVDMRDGALPRLAGIPIRVSDKIAVVPNAGGAGVNGYRALLVKRNALVFWYAMPNDIETDRDILSDVTVAAMHVYYVKHRYRRPNGGTKTGIVKLLTL